MSTRPIRNVSIINSDLPTSLIPFVRLSAIVSRHAVDTRFALVGAWGKGTSCVVLTLSLTTPFPAIGFTHHANWLLNNYRSRHSVVLG